ncbi:hypothetical protein CONPUDRAFT_169679 [Coniophora puteana RWD-64-598 SS2]|uniref:Peptide hydrolase n=1 Tax=Coniophora puteana (strain RWD-64-598) TaxID=741705 RepID=A0A5M3M9E9_CONPW|nr:uncharacterized protein CONPUDRAFT_169679 [Coniophora puteana RWD-64-598 SS2]EIW75315.1 hypothetical protein CONPUDRAFT_169679 [Coniophora puteana RWD-64-598 SS2]
MSSTRPRWGPLTSFLFLSPLFIALPWFAHKHQYTLPVPNSDLYHPTTNLPLISESAILGYAKYLSEDVGYRTPGTREHALADAWMVDKANELKAECDKLVKDQGRKLECEVWRQEGSGSHRFDMMNKRLYKRYVDLSNIVIRVSDGTEAGKADAVLVNSHLDSTLPSPGAADDALAVGVMIECMRVLINTPDWSPKHAVVFLFNNAEESLQDGSHLFSTQHPIASTVRAVVNLEAAGTTGRELLFQATSGQMIEAYSKVPRPYGTIFANEIFSSGIILSDTDFRQFEQYLNVTGLDMAVVGNSYLYHMRKDLVENIEPGVAQHMAENTLALLDHLSSASSPLPTLTDGYTKPTTVFFSHLGFFFVYSFATARALYTALFVSSVVLVRIVATDYAPALRRSTGSSIWHDQMKGVAACVAGAVGAIVGANVVALLMSDLVLGRPLSWFTSERAPVLLYAPAALTGALISQLPFGPIHEKTLFTSQLLLTSFLAAAVQLAGVGSSAMFFLSSLSVFASLIVNAVVVNANRKGAKEGEVSLIAYAVAQSVPLLTGTQLVTATLDVFVPLTGRIGSDAPAEHIIATLVSSMTAYTFSLALAFVHRFGPRVLRRGIVFALLVSGVSIAYFAQRPVFDEMHQKRLFVIHNESLDSKEQHLHIAAADGAPGFDRLVKDIADKFGADDVPPRAVIMDDWNTDWDTLYPFSAFLSPYKIDLPLDPAYEAPWPPAERFAVTAVDNVVDEVQGTRKMTLKIEHPGIIWTVITFDAQVVAWELDDHPPTEFARHHIKEASFYGRDTWTLNLTIKLPNDSSTSTATATTGATTDIGGLKVDFIGIQERRMWPGKKADSDGSQAMKLFKAFDEWLEEHEGGTVDAMILGCLSGSAIV